jgi:3-phenylpropionate/trans-cinnamate dioxygenase ferredoxin subunit
MESVKPAIQPQEIQEGSAKIVRIKGEEVAVFKHQGQLCAIQNSCPDEGGQLSMGWIEGYEIVCPLHGYKFHVNTGACSKDAKLKQKFSSWSRRGADLGWRQEANEEQEDEPKTANRHTP